MEQIPGASETAKIADSLLVEAGGLCYEEASAISKEIISGIEPLTKLAKVLEDSVKKILQYLLTYKKYTFKLTFDKLKENTLHLYTCE